MEHGVIEVSIFFDKTLINYAYAICSTLNLALHSLLPRLKVIKWNPHASYRNEKLFITLNRSYDIML